MWSIPDGEIESTAAALWSAMAGLSIGVGETKLVANSKASHHLLPSLVPPMDRRYTLRFFFPVTLLNHGDEAAFRYVLSYFREVGMGWNTSETKFLDNALIGYCIRYPDL